jgi:hypothetical protein
MAVDDLQYLPTIETEVRYGRWVDNTFDDLVSRKTKEWYNLSIEHDSSECTMILLRWMHEHNAFCNEENLRL